MPASRVAFLLRAEVPISLASAITSRHPVPVDSPLAIGLIMGCLVLAVTVFRGRSTHHRIANAAAMGGEISAPATLRSQNTAGAWGHWRHGFLVVGTTGLMTWRQGNGEASQVLATLDARDPRRPTRRESLHSTNGGYRVLRGETSEGPVEVSVPATLVAILAQDGRPTEL
jgi:hypothetical protein